jgi:hypothetical protein
MKLGLSVTELRLNSLSKDTDKCLEEFYSSVE